VEFRLLGPVEVLDGGGVPVRLAGRRERTILALLALAAGRVVSVDRMVDAVWESDPPQTARRQVHTCISVIRKALGPIVHTREPGYLLGADSDDIDVARFDALVAAARTAPGPRESAELLMRALALWRGPALDGLTGLRAEAAALEERRLVIVEERVALELGLGRHAELVAELTGLVAAHPLRERLRAGLMLALHRCGRTAEALAVYRTTRRVLKDEFGVEPSAELRNLERAILAEDPGLAHDIPAGPAMLPPDLVDFTGRDTEIARIRRALAGSSGGAVPICVLSGRGGVGKTALAVHVAHALREAFTGGQLYVNLHGMRDRPADPGEVLARFLLALGVVGPAVPPGTEERAELYRNRLAGRKVLVLLDNARDEAQVSALLPGDASCAVLVTARSRLGGLAATELLDLDVFTVDDAVRLLTRVVGAARVDAEPAAATELVGRCGQLPLAVRIAAARLVARPHWLLSKLSQRLGDERERLDELAHGGLEVRASLALSYRGLPEPARRLFGQLGLVEAPDFGAWLPAALLGVPPSQAEALTELLVDARLLEVNGRGSDGSTRYRFHDLVRVYAREQGQAEEPRPVLERVLGAWLSLVGHAHRAANGGGYLVVRGAAARCAVDPAVLDRVSADPFAWLETERLGLVAAVRQAAELGLDEAAWDLAHGATVLLATRSHHDEWRQINEHALDAVRRAGNRRGEAALLYSVAATHQAHGRNEAALSCLDDSIAGFTLAGDALGCGLAHASAVHVARLLGRWELGLAHGEQALAALADAPDPVAVASVQFGLGRIRLELGEPDVARRLFDQSLAGIRASDCEREEAQVLYQIGDMHLRAGDSGPAREAFEAVLRLSRANGDRVGEAYALCGIGACHIRQGRHGKADASLTEALRICRDGEMRLTEAQALLTLGELHAASGSPKAASLLHDAADLLGQLNVPLTRAKALRWLGAVHLDDGDVRTAGAAWREAHAILAALGVPEAREVAELLTAIDSA
jgi:DNA-binding SARP family transcriptional activator/tetratricopeptide (TPR) repeat protein